MNILHLEPLRYDDTLMAELRAVSRVDTLDTGSRSEILHKLRSTPYDALFVRLGHRIDREVYSACPTIRFLVTPTTGLNHIDLDAAHEAGIQIISLHGQTDFLRTIPSTAEHTWGLLLALLRRLPAAYQSVLHSQWVREPFLGNELFGRTLGILGLGRLGTMVANYGLAFGMRVLAHDITPREQAGVRLVSLEELLHKADVLTLHLPLNHSTSGYLSAERISAMSPRTVVINTARGELVDEVALLDALQNGRIAGAALDVLSGDSVWTSHVDPSHPLVRYAQTHDNLIITPHIGGYAREAIQKTRAFVTREFLRRFSESVL